MRLRFAGLWRHADFVKLWAGQTISLFGSQITFLALPLTAVLVLDATPAQMGFLTAAEAIPSLLVGLFIGVWVDRYRRRPILIAADLGRAALLLVIPVAAILGVLRIECFASSTCTSWRFWWGPLSWSSMWLTGHFSHRW
jgi:MFS family permease